MSPKKVYLDHSATTPVDKTVLKKMLPYFMEKFGNASSVHNYGQGPRQAVEKARKQVSDFLHCKNYEVIFTSGATESNNLAIKGIVDYYIESGKKLSDLHVITSQIEHPAILEPLKDLKKKGLGVTFLPVNKKGLVELSKFKKAVTGKTVLATIMYVNNEVGTVQPIAEIGEAIKTLNKKRKNKIFFHTDGAQAVNYANCKVDGLGVDLLSMSGHKIYGPKGIGALYIREGTPLVTQQLGGHHEYNIRAGTLPTPLMVGLGQAVSMIKKERAVNGRIKKLRDYFKKEILKRIPGVLINGDFIKRVPSNLNVCFRGAEGESILMMLDMVGIAVSTGSACSSGSLEPSHVLTAMNVPKDIIHGSVRFTLGKSTTKTDIDYTLKHLVTTIEKLRKMAP